MAQPQAAANGGSKSLLSSSSASSTSHFLAGLSSGTFSALLLQPVDLVKTRVQQSGSASIRTAVRDIAQSPNALGAFWRGAIPSALRTGFGSAIYFSSLAAIRRQTTSPTVSTTSTDNGDQLGSAGKNSRSAYHSSSLPRRSNMMNLASGATARAFAGFVLSPLTVIKVRFESNFYTYPSMAGAARDIYRSEGLRGFFVGYGATTARDAPYAGLYILFYEQAKRQLSKAMRPRNPLDDTPMGTWLSTCINFTSGASASAFASLLTNPFDCVKTRIQLKPTEYTNMFQASHRMVTEEGFRSLYHGLGLRMVRKALSSAVAWCIYEEVIRKQVVNKEKVL